MNRLFLQVGNMRSISSIYKLKPGDVLFRQLVGVLIMRHYGCFAGFDWRGKPWVFEHSEGVNSRLVPWEVFAMGYQVYVEKIADAARPAAVARMRELLETPREYHRLKFNCESAKNYVIKGDPYSIQSLMVVLVVGAGIVALSKSG